MAIALLPLMVQFQVEMKQNDNEVPDAEGERAIGRIDYFKTRIP